MKAILVALLLGGPLARSAHGFSGLIYYCMKTGCARQEPQALPQPQTMERLTSSNPYQGIERQAWADAAAAVARTQAGRRPQSRPAPAKNTSATNATSAAGRIAQRRPTDPEEIVKNLAAAAPQSFPELGDVSAPLSATDTFSTVVEGAQNMNQLVQPLVEEPSKGQNSRVFDGSAPRPSKPAAAADGTVEPRPFRAYRSDR